MIVIRYAIEFSALKNHKSCLCLLPYLVNTLYKSSSYKIA